MTSKDSIGSFHCGMSREIVESCIVRTSNVGFGLYTFPADRFKHVNEIAAAATAVAAAATITSAANNQQGSAAARAY
jgi:hypothetical protein